MKQLIIELCFVLSIITAVLVAEAQVPIVRPPHGGGGGGGATTVLKCDGTANDTANINAALTACSSGTAVQIAAGSCLVSSTLFVPSNCTFMGQGAQTQLTESAAFSTTDPNKPIIANTHDQTTGDTNVTIRDLAIVGLSNVGSINATGIWLTKMTTGLIANVKVVNADNQGIAVDSSTSVRITGNEVTLARNNGIYIPSFVQASSNITVDNNRVDATTTQDCYFAALAPVPSGAGSVVNAITNLHLNHNTALSCGDVAIEVGGAGNLGVQHKSVEATGNIVNGASTGVLFRNVVNSSITGNSITNTTKGCIVLWAAEANVFDDTVSGNTCTGALSGWGIHGAIGTDTAGNAYSLYNDTISGNTVEFPSGFSGSLATGGTGVHLVLNDTAHQACGNFTIVGNTIENTPNVGIAVVGATGAIINASNIGHNTINQTSFASSNPWGVQVDYCTGCSASGNTVTNYSGTTSKGFEFNHDTGFLFFGNSLANNTVAYLNNGNNTIASPAESALTTSGVYGNVTSTAGSTKIVACTTALNYGHVSELQCVTDLAGGSCTTAPTFNVRDNTTPANGTGLTCSTTDTTAVTQSESLTISPGDVVCITRTINGATCVAPIFTVAAHIALP